MAQGLKCQRLFVDPVMVPSNNSSMWYARRNGTVRGPFTDEYLARYILLGRIRLTDEISLDRIRWRLLRESPELFPEELRRLSSWEDYQRLVVARMKVDERVSERREDQGKIPRSSAKERREVSDRRRFDSDAEFFRYHLLDEIPCNPYEVNKRHGRSLRTFLLATLLVTLVFAFFRIST
jgi:hypothetical protein